MALTLVSGPALEPVSLDTAKSHCRVEVDEDDDLIESLVTVARRTAEHWRNEALITQTWNLLLDAWPEGDALRIPNPPLQSVSSITYKDTDGDEATFAAANYIVDTDKVPGAVVLAHGASWPGTALYPTSPITVQFVAGYGDTANDVPEEVRQAMLLMIGHWYENREEVAVGRSAVVRAEQIPLGARFLLGFERKIPGYSGF